MLYFIMAKYICAPSRVSNKLGICAYCNRVAYLTIDHQYPQYLWKWSKAYINEKDWSELYKFIGNKDNKVKCCEGCNTAKGNLVIFSEPPQIIAEAQKVILDVHKLFLDRGGNNHCIICNKLLTPESMVLRRKASSGQRVIENAVALCNDSNCHCRFTHDKNVKRHHDRYIKKLLEFDM